MSRKWLLTLLMVALLTTMVACSSPEEEAPAPAEEEAPAAVEEEEAAPEEEEEPAPAEEEEPAPEEEEEPAPEEEEEPAPEEEEEPAPEEEEEAAAMEEEPPTVAIIRLGPLPPFELSTQGTMDQLEAYGYVDGENINVLLYDAGMDVPTANTQIEDAIDEGADYLITITTPVTLAAINATQDMGDPPYVLFNTVTEPYESGIAESPCEKPDYVWGSQALPDFEQIMPLVFDVNPDIQTVGVIYSTSEPNAVASVAIMEPVAEDLGLDLVIESVAETAEVGLAAESAASAGIEAFFIPTDSTVGNGLAAILGVAADEGIPVFFADSAQAYAGVTVGAGLSYYQEGVDTARVLIAHLNDEIDIANTALSKQPGTRIGINLDTAASQGVEIPQALLDKADFVIEGEESTEEAPSLPDVSLEELMALDSEFIAGLNCSE